MLLYFSTLELEKYELSGSKLETASGTGRRLDFGGDEPWGLEKSSYTDCSDTLTLEKSSLCLLTAETDTAQEPRTTTEERTSEVRDVSTHIRFSSSPSTHFCLLQGPLVLGFSLLPVSKQSKTLHFPSSTWRQMSDEDGHGRTTRWAIYLGPVYISHTPVNSPRGMRSLSPNREMLTSAVKGCWIVYRVW